MLSISWVVFAFPELLNYKTTLIMLEFCSHKCAAVAAVLPVLHIYLYISLDLSIQSSGALRKSRWPSWVPAHNKPTVSVDVKQNLSIYLSLWKATNPPSCMKVTGHTHTSGHTPSLVFRHLPPNSATIGYCTEGTLFISTHLSADGFEY